ncbi:ATP-binding protein, partial [Streptomyces sp. NPDC055051]
MAENPTEAGGRARWDDGLIARRAAERAAAPEEPAAADAGAEDLRGFGGSYGGGLRARLDALHELVGLSRTRVESTALAEAGRVLDEAAARQRLSSRHTVVALAGATGSGKST